MSKTAYFVSQTGDRDEPDSAIDRQAVRTAMRKVAPGEELTSRAQSLMQRYEKERNEQLS